MIHEQGAEEGLVQRPAVFLGAADVQTVAVLEEAKRYLEALRDELVAVGRELD